MKRVLFMLLKYQVGDVIPDHIADVIKAEQLTVGAVHTDEGGEFGGNVQPVLTQHSCRHQLTFPSTPQYNGVAGRALGLLQEKAMQLREY